MTLSGIYLGIAFLALASALAALIRARKLYFFAPVYFLMGWLTGELALHHLAWQVGFSVLCIFGGILETGAGQLGFLAFLVTWIVLLRVHNISITTTPVVFRAALEESLGTGYRAQIPSERKQFLRDDIELSEWLRPFSMRRPGVKLSADIPYAEGGERNLLDIYSPEQEVPDGAPVLLQIHGGGWIIGHKREQALPLMNHLTTRGWVCVAINYRLSPANAMPAHIIDVKKAIAWVREHIRDYGGNPDFLAITGGSAGGHLSSLAALTPNDPEWQAGFEEVDTTIQAAVPFYGVYDFLDSANVRQGMTMEGFLADRVFKCTRLEHPELWHKCSTINHVRADAPPMFVVQGTHDTLVWNEEAHIFVDALRAVSEAPVGFAELPGAQHAYEMFHSPRTEYTLNAVTDFLEYCYAAWQGRQLQSPGK